jgi:hypothetical protein
MTKDRLKIIIDLDQTLISAEDMKDYDSEKHKKKSKKFTSVHMENHYIVFERPGLQDFLDFIFNGDFDVSVWTAASKDYALFIIDKIIIAGKSDRKLDWIFFSYHCDISKKHTGNTKDLSILYDVYNIPGYSVNNTIIIDDYDEVQKTQPNNCIIAYPFEFENEGSENDNYLPLLKQELIKINKNKMGDNVKLAKNANIKIKSYIEEYKIKI